MKNSGRSILWPAFLAGLIISLSGLHAQDRNDRGYLIFGPEEEIRTKEIKKDQDITAFHQEGAIITDMAPSPWYKASLFAHGSVIRDKTGKALVRVNILETTDEDGDQTWSVLWQPDARDDRGSIEIIQGTGKYAGITGIGSITGLFSKRSDGFLMPEYEISWSIDPEDPPYTAEIPDKDRFEFMDKCLSFHGPHVFVSSREFSNGTGLEFNTQSGVLLSQIGPDHPSPRNGATCYDTGVTVRLNGKVLGDIMLLEDCDADGDVVWLQHIWWYNKGPGMYKFIGGTGKWEGIEGHGRTRGSFRARSDDHYMLKSELRWNINR